MSTCSAVGAASEKRGDMSHVLHLAGGEARLRDGFLRWQCRLRQVAARRDAGRPGSGCVPALTLAGESEPLGRVVTVLSKQPAHSMTSEFKHVVRREPDHARRREAALKLFSETYYQHHEQFSDTLTCTFPPASAGAARIESAGRCLLRFEQFRQVYELDCGVRRLGPDHPLREATYWHNLLFNPQLPADCCVLVFEPNWREAQADPPP